MEIIIFVLTFCLLLSIFGILILFTLKIFYFYKVIELRTKSTDISFFEYSFSINLVKFDDVFIYLFTYPVPFEGDNTKIESYVNKHKNVTKFVLILMLIDFLMLIILR